MFSQFPWYMVDHITLKERTQIYNATVQLVTLLFQRVQNNDKPITLNMQLLKRVLLAALKCAGFTQAMKAEIRLQAGFNDFDYQLAPYAEHWLFQTVGPKKGSEYDTIMVNNISIYLSIGQLLTIFSTSRPCSAYPRRSPKASFLLQSKPLRVRRRNVSMSSAPSSSLTLQTSRS